MTVHFYAADYADERQTVQAFTSKQDRDGFVDGGNRRFAKTRSEADKMCKKIYECSALEAVKRGFI